MAPNWGNYLVYNAHSWSPNNLLLESFLNRFVLRLCYAKIIRNA